MTQDAIERLDASTGQEELIELREGQYFAESVHFVVNGSSGLAIGEYRPNSLSVLGKWPGALISTALTKFGTVEAMASQPVTFQPFPTVDFLQRAIGKQVKKFHVKFGPISPELQERAGVSSEIVEELTLGGNIMGFDLDLAVSPTDPLSEGIVQRLVQFAGRIGDVGAQKLMVTLEDTEAFDLLNDNLVYYAAHIDVLPEFGRGEIRAKTLAELRSRLASHEPDLLKMRG
ncbi:MAG TPA: hypothetical protein VGS23_01315 [Thermoplasmata archaeon]|nr:hypothetical protein [Thermoplasmata archaeon]